MEEEINKSDSNVGSNDEEIEIVFAEDKVEGFKKVTNFFKKNAFKLIVASAAAVAAGGGFYFFSRTPQFLELRTQLVGDREYPMASEELMDTMKTRGCVFDGLLTGYGNDFDDKVKMLGRSECMFLHRAVETWNNPPDFVSIGHNINAIKSKTGKQFIFGMFIAESIHTKAKYYYPDEKRNFDFKNMCDPGTIDDWGEDTCKPTFASAEYQKYLKYITRRAIDLGIREITFGQVYYQDPKWEKNPLAGQIVNEIRAYADFKEKDIAIGAQTNSIDDEKYLQIFDFITGGVGQNMEGYIEDDGPCWSVFWNQYKYCWAMLWNEKFKSKANNILVYLDWNNESSDDMNRFVRMPKETRRNFLGKAYDFFLWRGVGFLMPLGAVLDGSGNGCYGPEKVFYSASKSYSCRDEDAINKIFKREEYLPNYSKFISQDVPEEMEAGEKYEVAVTFENTSLIDWTKEKDYKLGSENPADNEAWGLKRVKLFDGDVIRNKESKTFRFEVTAPEEPGQYNFQWRMLREEREWFGQTSESLAIKVVAKDGAVAEINEAENTGEFMQKAEGFMETQEIETESEENIETQRNE